MTKGDQVRVFPHGSPDQAAVGTIVLISSNERSIAVAFDFMPPFAFHRGAPIGIHPDHGVVMLASRFEFGPWIEMMSNGHYEIEPVETVEAA